MVTAGKTSCLKVARTEVTDLCGQARESSRRPAYLWRHMFGWTMAQLVELQDLAVVRVLYY